MNFSKKRIVPSKKTKKKSSKRKYRKRQKKSTMIFKFVMYTIVFFLISFFVLAIVIYQKYIIGIPSIKDLENLEIAEISTIYDREGGELYKIYKEKRTYIPFEEINKNMINAIIAGEDKRYWEHPGVDIIGIIRAVIYKIIGRTSRIEGTSTIVQQLIRNTIISSERKIERKIKEMYLSYQLSKGLSKEKILELYLNKISFGHNSYGIEQASKTFFGKKAIELGILESSILASLPKGPTHYSPYNHPDRVVGYPYVYTKEDEEKQEHIVKIITRKDNILNKEMVGEFTNFIKNLNGVPIEGTSKILICNLKKENFKININIDNDLCSVLEYSKLLRVLNGIKISKDDNIIEYQTGRKDFILGRMLEERYISFEEYKDAIINSISMKFLEIKEKIKSPHFVFFVKEYLEKKYGKEIIESGGLKIYTTLDPKLQKKAEELVDKYSKINEKKFNASNAALLSIDNQKGEILSMIGGKDYFDVENKGNVNIITSKLQPGSTFKPFVYSMGIYNNQIGTKTPIYDVETEFSRHYTPSNFDGAFMGKMNIGSALNHSRNIPAIKMFFLAGGEKEIVNFMSKLGVTSLKNHNKYGAPLALGAGEITPFELGKAYSVFANMGVKKEITPILKIVDSRGNVIKEELNKKEEQVISKEQTYIINNILTDTKSRPDFWNPYLTIPKRKLAAKTGTSTKQFKKNGKKMISPMNLWTVGYTPGITTVTWAGNTDGSKLNNKGNGLEGAGLIMRDYMDFAHKGKEVKDWIQPKKVEEINISEISGLMPNPEGMDTMFLTKSLFINKPSGYDDSFRQLEVDVVCNGKITKQTPEAAIKKVNLMQFHSLSIANKKWEDPVQEWANAVKPDVLEDKLMNLYYSSREKYSNIDNLITSVGDNVCERTKVKLPNMIIKSRINEDDTFSPGENYIEFAYKSDTPIKKFDVLIDDALVQEIKLKSRKKGAYIGTFYIPKKYKNKTVKLKLRIVDKNFYSNSEEKQIIIKEKDTIPPEIILKNPTSSNIKIYKDSYFNLKAEVKDSSNIRTINIKLDGVSIKVGITDRKFTFGVNSGKDISIGKHVLQIEAIDKDFNKSTKDVNLEVLER